MNKECRTYIKSIPLVDIFYSWPFIRMEASGKTMPITRQFCGVARANCCLV
jgi:hypothetical protein